MQNQTNKDQLKKASEEQYGAFYGECLVSLFDMMVGIDRENKEPERLDDYSRFLVNAHFTPACAGMNVIDIGPVEIQVLIDLLPDQRMKEKFLEGCKRMFEYGIADGLVSENPCHQVNLAH